LSSDYRRVPLFALALLVLLAAPRYADATTCPAVGPVAANAKTDVVYDPLDSTMKACVAGSWLTMSGGGGGGGNLDDMTDVVITTPSTNQALVYNGAAWINATLSLTETDPQVGTLTATKWCAANAGGTAIVCNQAAPSGGGSSSGTAGFVQISGGSGAFASSSTTAGQQLFWDSTNHRLGIGVNTPTTQLTIGTSGTVTVQNGGSAAAPAYAVTTGGLGVNGMFVPAANSVAFVTSATERVRIDGSGNLGVGTTGPSAKLHVNGGNAIITPGAGNYATTFTGAGASALSITGGIANNEYARLTFGNGAAGNYAGIGAQITGGGSYLLLGTSNNYGTGITNEAIVISPTGNVGVGLTPNGAATLHVKGNAPILALEGTDHAYQSWYPAGYAAGRKAWLGFGGAGTSDFGIWNETATGAINLATNGGSRIYIKADGNVGIGTTNPSNKLEVATGSGGVLAVGDDAGGYTRIRFFGSAANSVVFNRGNNTGSTMWWGEGSDTGAYSFRGSGNFEVGGAAYKPGGGSWSASSDARLKAINGPYQQGLDSIVKLNTVRFHYKKDNPRKEPSDRQFVGLIAQDVQKVFPEAVKERADGYLDLDTTPINFALINAVKELKTANDNLAHELAQQKSLNEKNLRELRDRLDTLSEAQ